MLAVDTFSASHQTRDPRSLGPYRPAIRSTDTSTGLYICGEIVGKVNLLAANIARSCTSLWPYDRMTSH